MQRWIIKSLLIPVVSTIADFVNNHEMIETRAYQRPTWAAALVR